MSWLQQIGQIIFGENVAPSEPTSAVDDPPPQGAGADGAPEESGMVSPAGSVENVPVTDETRQLASRGRFTGHVRRRLLWVRSHPVVMLILLLLTTAAIMYERRLLYAAPVIRVWLKEWGARSWKYASEHPLPAIVGGVVLLYLVFGLGWMRFIDNIAKRLWQTYAKRKAAITAIAGILILIGLWISNYHDTWDVLPFELSASEKMEMDGAELAIQLAAELNRVGSREPVEVLSLWEMQPPRTSEGIVTLLQELPLEECDIVLQGPSDFDQTRRISLQRDSGDQGNSQTGSVDLGTFTIGGVSIPSRLFAQAILRVLPLDHRELKGNIVEAHGDLKISVSTPRLTVAGRDSGKNRLWHVTGPGEALPEMIEYLALRMVIDLSPQIIESSGLETAPSDQELAFAVASQAFIDEDFVRARIFLELADRFASPPHDIGQDAEVDAMRGLTYYKLVEENSTDPESLRAAVAALEKAVALDPAGDHSLLRPYLACLHAKAGNVRVAQDHVELFREFQVQRTAKRSEEVQRQPMRGPGRHLIVTEEQVIVVNEQGTILQGDRQGRHLRSLPFARNPDYVRQIDSYANASGQNDLVLVTARGAVSHDLSSSGSEPDLLGLGSYQQVRAASTARGVDVFVLDHLGKVFWCNPEAEETSIGACPVNDALFDNLTGAEEILNSGIRQLFPVGDQLFMLAGDRSVWTARLARSGGATVVSNIRNLTPPAAVREIFPADDGAVFLLYDGGIIYRYDMDDYSQDAPVKLIDAATDTEQIFVSGTSLYLLKSNGAVWRISNPLNPTSQDFAEIAAPPEGTTVREIFVVPDDMAGERVAVARKIYLLTDKALLLGTDRFDGPITLDKVSLAPVVIELETEMQDFRNTLARIGFPDLPDVPEPQLQYERPELAYYSQGEIYVGEQPRTTPSGMVSLYFYLVADTLEILQGTHSNQSMALRMGFADYFASTHMDNQPVVQRGMFGNHTLGPDALSELERNAPNAAYVVRSGWARSCWTLRERYGAETADKAFLQVVMTLPANSSIYDAILAAEEAFVEQEGEEAGKVVRDAFAEHGAVLMP